MGTDDQPLGSNFMFPYDLVARRAYIQGHHRTTMAQYNNRHEWPALKDNDKDAWGKHIVLERAGHAPQAEEGGRLGQGH